MRKLADRDSTDPGELRAAWDQVADIALTYRGWSDAKRQVNLGKLVLNMSESKVKSDAAYARCIDALCRLMGLVVLHQDFAGLGESVVTQLLVNPKRKDLDWESSPYADIYLALLREAAATGKLRLDAIPEVAEYRAAVKKCAPTIDWNEVAAPGRSLAIPQARFCGYADLEKHAAAWATSLKALLSEMALRGAAMPIGSKQRNEWGKLFRTHIVPLLNDIAGREAVDKPAKPVDAIQTVLGAPGAGVEVNAALLGNLISSRQGMRVMNERLAAHMSHFKAAVEQSGLFADDAMKPLITAWTKALDALLSLPKGEDFNDRYDQCYFYTVGPLDKDAVASLAIGREVACCLSPEGEHFVELIQRLVNPAWVPIVVRDDKKTPSRSPGLCSRR